VRHERKSNSEKSKETLDSAVTYIRNERKRQGDRRTKIPRREIERAVMDKTGFTKREIDEAIAKIYDEMAALGLVKSRD